ncbi:hypothetical protein K5I29_06275 [Flavobacterium agricola]|uniref:Uncharacterized protein n=1 Tax=Flavobacterium agricola TaxID=2870839 RepID=A0ABY6M1S1_9FLAO|nr:hypothetical protein [Flavobacterium agricola]UYW02486.1 hypothetical protein K5I29_06275 [Flavobacterium agricola]
MNTKLKKFQVEELEQRFEMGWFVNDSTEVSPVTGQMPNNLESIERPSETWYGIGVKHNF